MSDKLYSVLEKKMSENGYLTVQETINAIVRDKLIPSAKPKSTRTRSKPFELEDLYTRDKTKAELLAEQKKRMGK